MLRTIRTNLINESTRLIIHRLTSLAVKKVPKVGYFG